MIEVFSTGPTREKIAEFGCLFIYTSADRLVGLLHDLQDAECGK